MSWEADQDRLTRKARLYSFSPEAVFEELKRLGRRGKIDLLTDHDESIEPVLLERNEPLINLGLACYGTHRDVFKALYKHSLAPARDEADAHYKNGLRIGCLSNQVITRSHFFDEFPSGLIGPEETRRVFVKGSDAELSALLRNPSISEKLLEALYSYTDPIAPLDEERWRRLVSISSKNERIQTQIDYYDSSDSEHYSIHKAIFRLLEIAPVKPVWLHVLYYFLLDLDFQQVHSPESIDKVLSRWAKVEDRDSGDKPFEGPCSPLPLKDEFRCLIAAMYGWGFRNNSGVLFGNANARDVALRCTFYGKAEITTKDMKAGYKRDKDVYVFAVVWNKRLYTQPELRSLFEEKHSLNAAHGLFKRNFNLVKKKRDEIAKRGTEQPEDDSGKRLVTIEAATETLSKNVNGLAKELADMKRLVIIGGVALAILIYWAKH